MKHSSPGSQFPEYFSINIPTMPHFNQERSDFHWLKILTITYQTTFAIKWEFL